MRPTSRSVLAFLVVTFGATWASSVATAETRFINMSARGQVQTGDNVMIAGFIIHGDSLQTVVVRARGPSLAQHGVHGALANPRLQLFAGSQEIASNDDWQQNGASGCPVANTGLAPEDPRESAIFAF